MPNKTVLRCLLIGWLALAAWGADVTGTWTFAVETSAGSGTPTFVLKQDGEKLTGTYKGLFGEAPLTGSVKGNKIVFSYQVSAQGENLSVEYDGTIESPTKMKGTAKYGALGDATWAATKN